MSTIQVKTTTHANKQETHTTHNEKRDKTIENYLEIKWMLD
jgi:hypothetical protein